MLVYRHRGNVIRKRQLTKGIADIEMGELTTPRIQLDSPFDDDDGIHQKYPHLDPTSLMPFNGPFECFKITYD